LESTDQDRSDFGTAQVAIRLRSLTFHALGPTKAVFSEIRQNLIELNDLAAFLAAKAAAWVGFEELEEALVERGLTPAEAASAVKEFALRWSHERLLEVKLTPLTPSPLLDCSALDMTIAVAGRAVQIKCHDPAIGKVIAASFRQFEQATLSAQDTCEIVQHNGLMFLCEENGPGYIVEEAQVVPALKAILTEHLLAMEGDHLLLHCAAVIKQGRIFLLLGEPGSGKSIMTLALIKRGFQYAGDDIVVFDHQGRASPVPFLPALKSEAWTLAETMCLCDPRLPVHLRLDTKPVRYVPVDCARVYQPLPVSGVVSLMRVEQDTVRIGELSIAASLTRLIAGAHHPDRKLRAGQMTLHYSDATAAAAALDSHMRPDAQE
jgi:hypothetical protein